MIQEVGSVEELAHPGIFTDHMVFDPQKPDERPRHIGCPTRQEELERLGATFTFLDHPEEISPGLWSWPASAGMAPFFPKTSVLCCPEGENWSRT